MSHSKNTVQRLLRIFLIGVMGAILGFGNIVVAPRAVAADQPTAQVTLRNCPVAESTEQIIVDVTLKNSYSVSNRFWVKTELSGAPATAKSYDLAPGEKKALEITYAANDDHDQYGVYIAVYLDSDQENTLAYALFLPSDCSPPAQLKFPSVTYVGANALAQVNIAFKYVKALGVYNVNTGVRAYDAKFCDEDATAEELKSCDGYVPVKEAKTIVLNLGQGEYKMEVSGLVEYAEKTFIVTAPSPTTRVTNPRRGILEVNTQWAARNVLYWEDGTKKNGKWTYGKNRYVTKTGTDGIYKIDTPNVGNGKGSVSENRVRVTVQYMILGADLVWKKFGKPIQKVVVIRAR